jgi:hypothetical protein
MATNNAINHTLPQATQGFLALDSVDGTDVTGDGSDYSIIYETESYDVGSNYNTATGQFTAPVTGKYFFTLGVYLGTISNTHTTGYLQLKNVTTGDLVTSAISNPYNRSYTSQTRLDMTYLLPLTVGDIVEPIINISGGAKTVDVMGLRNWFACYLVTNL